MSIIFDRSVREGATCSSVQQGEPYLLVVGGDQPQLDVHVGAPLLGAQEVEQVLVPHAAQVVDLVLVLPRLLVLRTPRGQETGEHNRLVCLTSTDEQAL